ncbi:MAG TPA: hypothetical protein PKI20_21415 [Verrucomicrobiota bacterium]|jgi:hypothetical protein|nr:hypothetical protein [Verrucomicrobiota bacterium]HQL80320.1 hypothetical protein [Verrucomicrobiota bacterium]
MRKLIRSKATQAFLTADGQWTDQIQAAADFPGLLARDAMRDFQLRDLEVYYSFCNTAATSYDFTVSLD